MSLHNNDYQRFKFVPLAAAVTSALCTLGASNVLAQQATSLEEVVVTARKRAESIQDVPISVSALNGSDLKAAGVFNADSLFDSTPGATNVQLNKTQPAFSIRGVQSSSESLSGDSSVAFYVDGVYIARLTSQSVKYYDIDRIEVLRGPQGTVFGKNAAAGAVQVITNRPNEETEGRISAGFGNYGQWEVEGMFNSALSDSVLGRVAFSRSARDGYTTNLLTGNDVDSESNLSVRGQLLFDLNEDAELLLRAERVTDRDGVAARVNVGPDAYQPKVGPFSTPGALPISGDIRETYLVDDTGLDRKISAFSGELSWAFGDVELKSISAYRKTEVDQSGSLWPTYEAGSGNETYDLLHNDLTDDAVQKSQEFRLSSGGDNFNWLLGAYYMTESVDRHEERGLHTDINGVGSGPIAVLLSTGDTTTDSFAFFAEYGYDFTEKHNVTAGLRYSRDKKDINYNNNDLGGLVDASETWSAVTGGLSYTYTIDDDKSVYASYNRGHKPGGFNTDAETATALRTPFNEEFIDSYELGLKSDWLDNRMRTNLSVFYMVYSDRQVEVFNPGLATQIIDNTGETEHKGVEGELTYLATDNLKLAANFAFMRNTITKSEDPSVIGNEPSGAPKKTYMLSADYSVPLSDGGYLNFIAMYNFRGGAWQEEVNEADPFRYRGDAKLLNLTSSWTSSDENLKISAYVRNALDDEYITHAMPFGTPGDIGGPVLYGPPRTYGVSADYQF
ncbi:TonB-dependent receptor [uncultured Pseudoteredinibacter sp.]|uniref:TonB-dependent receptor n=1 Tax=uncultured Pseudoteredinibacter sp. TaxID=1641701 RepID=UPI0026386A3C|nr:TonB-dependent receptor [uncultured Pseudoteredinibacter sp.]